MTPAEFLQSLRAELHFRGVPFDGGALSAFAASVWPLAEDQPDAAWWADEFLAGQAAALVRGVAEGMRA